MDLDALLAARGRARRLRHPPEARTGRRWSAATATIAPLDGAAADRADLDAVPARGHRGRAAALRPVPRDAATSTSPTPPTDLPRFRVNAFRQRGAVSFALRVIPHEVPQLRGARPARRASGSSPRSIAGSCSSPARPARARRRRSPRCIDYINRTRAARTSSRSRTRSRSCTRTSISIVNQREVGLDTENFGQALRRALRQDPDTILIGELRDAETAQTALQAAESGHLVFSTLHTIDAAETVGRMIEFFPEGKQQQIRSIMAGVLRGVISPAAAAARRRRPRRRRRGDDHERAHRRPDPREQAGGDHRRDRRGRVLRHADLPEGADRARARRATSTARSPPTPRRTGTTSWSRSSTREKAQPDGHRPRPLLRRPAASPQPKSPSREPEPEFALRLAPLGD